MAEVPCEPEKDLALQDDKWLRDRILAQFAEYQIRITPLDLERLLVKDNPSLARTAIRSTLKKMIAEGILGYCCHNALTAIELNCHAYCHIGRRIALGSPGQRNNVDDDRVLITLADGASFGSGTHPTTQLCLQGLEFALDRYTRCFGQTAAAAIDIGTGTGILAIAAALLGVEKVLATDIDPIARFEARRNVEENNLEPGRVLVTDATPHALRPAKYDLVLANLRPPTLKRLLSEMLGITNPGGFWVTSGFRPAELEWMKDLDIIKSGRLVWQGCLKNWAAVAIQWA